MRGGERRREEEARGGGERREEEARGRRRRRLLTALVGVHRGEERLVPRLCPILAPSAHAYARGDRRDGVEDTRACAPAARLGHAGLGARRARRLRARHLGGRMRDRHHHRLLDPMDRVPADRARHLAASDEEHVPPLEEAHHAEQRARADGAGRRRGEAGRVGERAQLRLERRRTVGGGVLHERRAVVGSVDRRGAAHVEEMALVALELASSAKAKALVGPCWIQLWPIGPSGPVSPQTMDRSGLRPVYSVL